MDLKFQERILCAATLYDDGKKHPNQPINITGIVTCGYRHSNSILTMIFMYPDVDDKNFVQGFLTSKNRFVDRHEAFLIADVANQIINKGKEQTLVSEDLYVD